VGLTADDWLALGDGIGTVRVRNEDGTAVTDGNRAKAAAKEGVTGAPKPPDEVNVEIYDEIGNVRRTIDGGKVIERRTDEGPVEVLIVDDEVEPDAGETVQTRGAQSPGPPPA
jgi:hypothetical protein